MSILLRAGEYLWSSNGTNICDDIGFAIVCEADTEVVFDTQQIEDRAGAIIKAGRELRGVDPDTGLPAPEPDPEI